MIVFHISSLDNGWIEATITNEEKEVTISASILTDAPSELLIAVALLCEGVKETVCKWQEEPGEYQWLLKKDNNLIEVKILFFKQTFSRQSLENGQVIFYEKENLCRFAKGIANEFYRIKFDLTVDDYKKRWGYDFPIRALCRLSNAVKKLQI